jgi:hypothetical protein
LARFCTKKKAKYIDVIFLFIFIFHILAKFHTKITPIFQMKYSFLYLIFTFWQIFCTKLFTVLRPFGTKESIRQKVDHGGQIILWY